MRPVGGRVGVAREDVGGRVGVVREGDTCRRQGGCRRVKAVKGRGRVG